MGGRKFMVVEYQWLTLLLLLKHSAPVSMARGSHSHRLCRTICDRDQTKIKRSRWNQLHIKGSRRKKLRIKGSRWKIAIKSMNQVADQFSSRRRSKMIKLILHNYS